MGMIELGFSGKTGCDGLSPRVNEAISFSNLFCSYNSINFLKVFCFVGNLF